MGNCKDSGRFRERRGTEIAVNLKRFCTRVDKTVKGDSGMEQAWMLGEVIARDFQELRLPWPDSQALALVNLQVKLFW